MTSNPLPPPVPPPTRAERPTGWRRWLAILKISTRRRLISPMLRGQHDPAYYARASAVGFFINFTPTVGFQIPLVIAMWSIARISSRWEFHLGVASAWTLLTSIPTIPPMYYLFIVTGRLLLGRWDEGNDFGMVRDALHGMNAAADWWESLWLQAVQLWELFGLPLFVGSLPWGIGTGWIAYLWTLRLIRRHRQKKWRASPSVPV
ncbi:MAG: DUF2062 domain-containing protein [Magnetococcales bacterium]|nr:DUF2062 domain-containing protein [Magnetococcales bacterium]